MKSYFSNISGLVLFCLCGWAVASADLFPPVNKQTIKGVWEAISEKDIRVFRMEINSKDDSFLSFAVPGGPERVWVYKLDKLTVENGKLSLRFKETNGVDIIEIKGDGVAGTSGAVEEGVLHVNLVMNPDKLPQNTWTLKFSKHWNIAELHKLSMKGAVAIEKVRKDTSRGHWGQE